MRKKLLFIVMEDWYFLSHRLPLAIACKKNGYEVQVACNDTGKIDLIKSHGFNYHKLKLQRGYSSPFVILKNIIKIKNLINKSKPAIIHAVSIQSIIFILFASLLNRKIKIIAAVTGLGTLFITNNFMEKIIKYILTTFLIIFFRKKNLKIIVQNKDDENLFNKILFNPTNKIFLVRGSGIDIKYHKQQKEPETSSITISYVGRLIKDKGIEDIVEAFKIAFRTNNNIKLLFVGSIDNNNTRPISKYFIQETIKNNKNIKFLGDVEDVREIWKKSHIAILASKREGLPKSLLEAAAAGRAIISTDVIGSREIALDSINAKIVQLGDINSLAEAILFLSKSNKIRKIYGLKSRELVESDMSQERVIDSILSIYKSF